MADLRAGGDRFYYGDVGVDARGPTPCGRSVPVRQARRDLYPAGVYAGDGDATNADGSLAALQRRIINRVYCDAADRTGGGELG